MTETIDDIIKQDNFSREDIIKLLQADKKERNKIYIKSAEVKEQFVGKKAFYRGLIEFSNICFKDCHYYGIRAGNKAWFDTI